ncbi:hypothetical protein Gohar_018586 [Gossypium harknessii]|uniref:DUF4283 domain-containing protein n=1 Tax=Gossypium harknessii TaxID=34285 RepID=A0A7J9G9H9_9ROSI|nr:hypothetical protein [Gossypium harknessii]
MDLSNEPTLSWKDKLVSKRQSDSKKTVEFLYSKGDDDFEFCEGDIRKSAINGISSIEFLERVHQFLVRDMSTMVVLKLLRRNTGYATFFNRIHSIWRPFAPIQLMDIGNSYFLVKFLDKEDFDKVISQGPWVVFGQYLTVQPWTIDFNPDHPYLSVVKTWIRLQGLSGHLYKRKEACTRVGSMDQLEKQNSSTETPTKEVDMENGKDTYGLWMVVEKRSQSKGNELIVNSYLGVLINDSKVVGGISRELGSKVAQVGYVKMVGLSGPMVSGSLVDGSRDPRWTRAFSSKGPSKVIVFESRPNRIVKPTKILNGANGDFVISCSDSQAFNLEAQAVLKQNEPDFINEFSLYAYNVDSLAAGNSCLIVEINSNTTCHFKSTFEGLMEVRTLLSEGVLDPVKHSVITFRK